MFWITAVIAILIVGISKAGFGGGVGAIATPLLALTIPVADAASILLPLLIVADILAVRHYWKTYDRRSLQLLLPGAMIGIALGAFFFGYFSDNERVLKVILGVVSLVFVAYQVLRAVILGAVAKSRPPAAAGVLLGEAAGFTSTLAHSGGPPAPIYLLPQALPREIFVGTNVIFFFTLNVVKLIPYSLLGLLQVGNLTTILVLAPLAIVGVQLGIFLNKRFSEKWFNRFVYAMLFLTGLELVSGSSIVNVFFH